MASQTSMQRSPKTFTTEDKGSKHPVGTGPFVFKEWQPDRVYVGERNKSYWRKGEPHVDRIEFRPIVEDGVRASALRSNDIDMMFTISAKDANDLDADHTVVRDWDSEPGGLGVNTRPKIGDKDNPMSNIHARRAVAMATDRHYIAESVGDGVQTYSGPFASTSPWGQPEDQTGYVAYDPDGARKEVALYLADTGTTELEVSLLGANDTNSASVMQTLQAQWKEVGITSTIKTVDANALIQGLLGSVYELGYASVYSAPDPDQDYLFWSAANIGEYGKLSINFSGFANDTTERLLKEGRATDDPAKRREIFNQLSREHNKNLTTIWLNATPFSLVASSRIHGLKAASEVPFANYQPKTWWGGVWIAR